MFKGKLVQLFLYQASVPDNICLNSQKLVWSHHTLGD
uniref:Uncharacterized protein n=1 Tax=Anguilla anguilla TaxID=7936 RepID=A0A0E9PWH7_ANGAN